MSVSSVVAAPAAACGFDGMFGYNHYSDAAPDQAAADAMRNAAIAQARDTFMARHGMQETTGDAAADATGLVPETVPQTTIAVARNPTDRARE